MQLINHTFCDADTERRVSTHGPLHPRHIVLHNTQLNSATQSIDTLQALGLGYHVLIERDGTVHQLAPLDQIVHHAGLSNWRAQKGLNASAIGVSFVNLGPVGTATDRENLKSETDKNLLRAPHHNGDQNFCDMLWENYSAAQLSRGLAICKSISDAYPIQEIVRHDDIAIGRKVDTGPALSMEPFRTLCPTPTPPEASRRYVSLTSPQECPIRTAPQIDAEVIAHLHNGAEIWELSRPYRQDGEQWVESDWLLVSQNGTTRLGFIKAEHVAFSRASA